MTALAYDVRTVCEDDPSLFHAPDQEAPAAKRWRETEAKHYCLNLCPAAVRESCLQIAMEAEHGLSAGNRWGLYGGLNEQERADLDKKNSDAEAGRVRCEPCRRDFVNLGAYRAHETHVHRSDSRADTIRELAAAGYNDRQIGEHLGMPSKTVFAIRSRHNITAAMPVPQKKKAS